MAVETVREIFESYIPGRLEKAPELVEKVNASYKFVVTGDDACTWVVDMTQPGGSVTEADTDANCTVTIAGSDLLDLISGKLNGQVAFMTGKIKVSGEMALAMKLGTVLG